MWSQKYAPKHLKDLLLDDYTRNKLNTFIQNRNIPNFIVSGITGVGKSNMLDCLARDYYGKLFSSYVLKLNSSIDKTIKSLQETLESFCRKKLEDPNEHRMIIIDDIDIIPEKFQRVFALVMKDFPKVYFVFSCNNTSDIIEVIQSYCLIIQVQRLSYEQIQNYLELICRHEKCPYSKEALGRVCFLSQGDIRLAINNLQILCEGFGDVSIKNVDKICPIPNVVVLKEILQWCSKKETKKALESSMKLYECGYDSSDILSGFFDLLRMPTTAIPDETKIRMLEIIGKTRYNVSRKNDNLIQLEKCIIKICS